MKKAILIGMVLVLALSVLTACGPNYAKELDVIRADMEELNDEWLTFATEYGEEAYTITNMEELNDFYLSMAEEAGTYAEKYEVLEGRLDDIQDGISDAEYTAYKTSIGGMIDAIQSMQEQMEAAVVAE